MSVSVSGGKSAPTRQQQQQQQQKKQQPTHREDNYWEEEEEDDDAINQSGAMIRRVTTGNREGGGEAKKGSEKGGDETAEEGEEEEPEKERGFFDGFNVWKVVAAAAVGTAIGIGYSVVDQTILHKPKPQVLPYMSDVLQYNMPDIVERAEKFYSYRRLVRSKLGKQEFDRLAREMLKQSEYFAAIYARIMRTHSANGGITPASLQQHFQLKTQAKKHWDVIVQYLRAMAVLIGTKDNLVVENDFNRLYEAFQNRFYNIHQSVLGVV